ncbi:MAG TPA: hypothetical protein VFN48_09030 [Solirubrobacteraceae bacterium]|nr:hypothetical protein [Solirubrobacteraceae bacterium]
MFHARQLFRRSSTAPRTSGPAAKVGPSQPATERHPAMRGLDVSPVHGRHCICGRCAQHTKAA